MSRFLYQHLKGRRALVAIAIALTFAQVGCDLFAAFPLKFILDKIVHHLDPPNLPVVTPVISYFDQFGTRNGLDEPFLREKAPFSISHSRYDPTFITRQYSAFCTHSASNLYLFPASRWTSKVTGIQRQSRSR